MESSFGEYLRQQRETREFSLDGISAKTKIQKKFLLALEKDQYEQLPGLIFVRGFIRAYAEQVGLNPEQTLLRFEEYLKETKPALSGPKSGPIPQKSRAWVWGLAGLFVLILIGLVGSLIWSLKKNPAARVALPAPARPSPGQGGAVATSLPAPVRSLQSVSPPFSVSLKANELCWVLTTIDGKAGKEMMLYSEDSFKIEAQEKLSLLIGNAGGVEIVINGVRLKPIGGHWKPMRFLIPEDLPKYLPEKFEKPAPKTPEPKPESTKPQ